MREGLREEKQITGKAVPSLEHQQELVKKREVGQR